MLGSIRRQFRLAGELALGGLLAVALVACAASTAPGPDASAQAEIVQDVRVEHADGTTLVTLMGLHHPVFTAFQQPNPARVVLDLSSVEAEGLIDPIAVHDGLVETVTLAPFATGADEPMMRVEVALLAPAEYEVVPGSEGLVIRLMAMDGAASWGESSWSEGDAGQDDEAADPWAISPLGEDAAAGEAAGALAPEQAKPATALTAVEARRVGNGLLVHLRADGMVLNTVSFTLAEPDRLVVDLPGLRSQVERGSVEVGDAHAARVRVGQHDDMVRVVIDAGDAAQAFDGRRLVPAANGLLLALGSDEQLDWELAQAGQSAGAAPAEASEVADASESAQADAVAWEEDWAADEDAWSEPTADDTPELAAQDAGETWEAAPAAPADEIADAAGDEPALIYGVEYDTQASRDRIVVLGDRPVDYLVYEPDDETLVLAIEGAVIDPEAAVRIAPEKAGPVSLITAFEQPDVKTSEVRLVVKRAPGLDPEISRRGSLLVVDFPRTGESAATPPVLASTPETPILSDAGAGEAAAQPKAATQELALGGSDSASELPAAPAPELAPALGSQLEALPASLEPAAAIDILNEGGLIDGKEYTGRRISLDFKDVEIADVLRLIAEVSDLNVIAGDEVSGRVTIRLVDVPWDQALDVILLTKSLGFMRVGNVLRIAPADVIAQEEELRLQERRAKEKLEDLVVKLQPVNYGNVKDVLKMVKQLLSPRGTVHMDKRTNTLIIKDIPSVIDEATALVKAVDTQTPQVMIEAKIVEAALDFSREFGSVWGLGAQRFVDGFDPASGPRTDLGNDLFRLHDDNNILVGNSITSFPNALMNITGFILDEKLDLDLQLQAAESTGDGKVISSPRVVTLDNSEAKIKQGVSIPFQTFENGDAQLEFVDAVLELKVTPHITSDRSIIMEVKVTRNAPDDSVFTLTGSPAIAKNEVDTETLVKDGQTLVLGGIYVIDKSERKSRVPYLYRIPLLGMLFRSNEFSDARKELLVFVTPRVVEAQYQDAS